jgi:CBS domain-containing protein
MPSAFNFAASPFDCLTPGEQRLVRDSVDVVYYPEGATILDLGMAPTHLLIIIKGQVSQMEGSEVVASYGPDDCFDGRALVAGRASSRFVAAEEVVAYQLARQAVSDLIAANVTFGALLFSDLSNKLIALSDRRNLNELQSLTMSRVDEAFLRPAVYADYDDSILSVVQVLQDKGSNSVLVRDQRGPVPRLGIFTARAVQRAILSGRPLDELPVGELSKFSLIEVNASDQLGEAMAVMLRHRVNRVVVVDDANAILGILEALDLFSFLSNQSRLITEKIELATDLQGLGLAAGQITSMIATLHRSGTRVNLIAKLVQQLNARLFDRAWQLIAPPQLHANSCLFVMGSEGRGEQLLKTDQDNGLVWRDGYEPPEDLPQICQRFSDALASFGYPPCPGHIMLSNPDWRNSAGTLGQMTRQWLIMPDTDGLMKLAIFMDAHVVCGDADLLSQVQSGLRAFATDNDALLSRFASAIDAFGSGQGWWNRLLNLGDSPQQINLKKEGMFALVHGVRSLALTAQLAQTSTVARIEALAAKGMLTREMAGDLTDSLHFFMGLRLRAGLAEMDSGKPVTGNVDLGRLSSLDRDLLKDTLGVVRRFKLLLRQRFHLEAL